MASNVVVDFEYIRRHETVWMQMAQTLAETGSLTGKIEWQHRNSIFFADTLKMHEALVDFVRNHLHEGAETAANIANTLGLIVAWYQSTEGHNAKLVKAGVVK